MWGVDYRRRSISTLFQSTYPRFQSRDLTLCIRILFRELDRGSDRLLGFLREFVVHRSGIGYWVSGIGYWRRICGMDLK